MPASRLGLTDRGVVSAGAVADLVVVDAAAVKDESSYADPHRYPSGIPYVVVNGQVAVDGGRLVGPGAGRVLTPPR